MNGRTLRIATYNVHKCRGMDRRVDVLRIAKVIRSLRADIVALQEILHGEHSQVQLIAERLGYFSAFGENRLHGGAPYGNATLARYPIVFQCNYDLTWQHRERRGCLRADVQFGDGGVLHLYNVHLGTSFFERPHQARILLDGALRREEGISGPRVVVGDFNEWTRGVATKLMGDHFQSVDAKLMRRSFPGVLPLLRLDHFYFDSHLNLEKFSIVRNRLALVASDHLPLVAEFRLSAKKEQENRREAC